DLVAARGEERVLLVGTGGGDVLRAHHPDAHPLVAPGVQVPGVTQGRLVVGGVQRTHVHVVEPALAAYEHLVQRPVAHAATPAPPRPARSACLAAYDTAA